MKELFFSTVLFFIPASFIERVAFTEERTVSGKVIAFDDSLPVEGVTVSVKGARRSTGTQADGTFYIRVQAPLDSVLVFSLAGFKSHELKLTGKSDYDVVLRRAAN